MRNKWKLGGMMLASLLTVASCQNEDIVSNEQVQGNYSLVVTNGVDSRTYVESDGTVKWSTGDKLFVYGTNVSGTLQLSKTENEGKTGTFTGFVSGNPGSLKWAVFGNNVTKASNGAKFTISNISNPNSNSPMVGEIKDGEVNLNHLCGMVRITINNLPKDKIIKLNGDDIAGTATVVDGKIISGSYSDDITISVTNPTEDPTIEVPVFVKESEEDAEGTETEEKEDPTFTLSVDAAAYTFSAPVAVGKLSEKAILELTCVVEGGKVTGFKQAATTEESFLKAVQVGGTISLGANLEFDKTVVIPEGVTVNLDLNGKSVTGPSSGYAFRNNGGNLTITGNGTVQGDFGALSTFGGKVIIENGTYISNGVAGTTHHCIYIGSGGDLVVNGGTFKHNGNGISDSGSVVTIYDYNETGATLQINGGTFLGEGYITAVSKYDTNSKLAITGGTFSEDVTSMVAEGHIVTDNSDGTYTVLPTGMSAVSGYSHLYTNGTDYYVYDAEGLMALNKYFSDNKMNNAVWTRNYNIMADIDATGYTWENVYMVTGTNDAEGINLLGNDHIISNLTITGGGMLGGTPNCTNSLSPAYVKNLTFDNATVTGNAHFASVIWGGAAICGSVYFEDVHILNSNIEGKCNVGAFIGGTGEQSATYDLTVTFKDCSVKNTTLVAAGNDGADPTGASAFIGRAYANTSLVFEGENTIEGNTITNNNGLVGGGIYGYTIWADGSFTGTGKCDIFTNWDGIITPKAWEDHLQVNSDITRSNEVAEDYVEICHNSGNMTLENITFKNGLTIFTNNAENNGTITLKGCTIYLNNGSGDPNYTQNTQHIAGYGLNLNLANGSDITFEFDNCTFTAAADYTYTGVNSYNVYIGGGYSAKSITFKNGCIFEGSGKHAIGCSSLSAGNQYDGVASQYYALSVTGCNFKNWNNDPAHDNGAAIRGNLPAANFEANITISGNTFGDSNNSTQSTVAIDSWTGTWN